ncbi:NUDIX domain-containing protein [Microbacterium sp.]|uniref:NUDIX domain-containing protein n=1 Tax=Microbacterium sp. TaxID=51671 RepID=UPI003F9685A2
MTETMLTGGTVVLLRDGPDGLETLMIRRPDRGSFAGAWVFPGGVVEDADVVAGENEQQTAARAAARECEEEVGLRPAELHAFSCWVPPAEAPKRVRTWFFLAAASEGELRPAPDEVVETRWLSPAEALRRHADDALMLFPPTWVTLTALAGCGSVADALRSASVPEASVPEASIPEVYVTHILGGGVFVWPGDAEHPDGGSGQHRLETGALPWRYTRG